VAGTFSITVFDQITIPGTNARNAPAHPARGPIHLLAQAIVYRPAIPAKRSTTNLAAKGDGPKAANASPSRT
jgi:hypothetical protein